MLATIGFLIAGLFFITFAYTFSSLVIKHTVLNLKSFSYAYYSLGVALIGWGVGSYLAEPSALSHSVVFGNLALMVGTLFMIKILFQPKWIFYTGIFLGAVFLFIRVKYYFPEPYLKDSILIFNTQTPIAVILGLVFSGIWLPANLKAATILTNKIKQPSLLPLLNLIYSLATISAVIFIASKRPSITLLSFASITVCFAMLISSNILIGKLEE